MTGKELKKFAEMVHDNAEVQVNMGESYRHDWKSLEAKNIQATLSPVVSLNLETVNG